MRVLVGAQPDEAASHEAEHSGGKFFAPEPFQTMVQPTRPIKKLSRYLDTFPSKPNCTTMSACAGGVHSSTVAQAISPNKGGRISAPLVARKSAVIAFPQHNKVR